MTLQTCLLWAHAYIYMYVYILNIYIYVCVYIYINNVIEQPSFASDVDVENQDKNGVFDPHLHLGLSEPMK